MRKAQIVHEIADVMREMKAEIYYCVSEYGFTPKDIVEKFIGANVLKYICDESFKEAFYSYRELKQDLVDYASLREAELNGQLTQKKQQQEIKRNHKYYKPSTKSDKSSRGKRVTRYVLKY